MSSIILRTNFHIKRAPSAPKVLQDHRHFEILKSVCYLLNRKIHFCLRVKVTEQHLEMSMYIIAYVDCIADDNILVRRKSIVDLHSISISQNRTFKHIKRIIYVNNKEQIA